MQHRLHEVSAFFPDNRNWKLFATHPEPDGFSVQIYWLRINCPQNQSQIELPWWGLRFFIHTVFCVMNMGIGLSPGVKTRQFSIHHIWFTGMYPTIRLSYLYVFQYHNIGELTFEIPIWYDRPLVWYWHLHQKANRNSLMFFHRRQSEYRYKLLCIKSSLKRPNFEVTRSNVPQGRTLRWDIKYWLIVAFIFDVQRLVMINCHQLIDRYGKLVCNA